MIQAIIVLVSVVSVVYILQSTSAFDPVEDFLLSSFGDRSYDQDQFLQSYEKEARRRHLHLPAFYFTVKPSYFPDDLQETLVRRERKHKTALFRFSRCASCVDQYLNLKSKLIDHLGHAEDLAAQQSKALTRYKTEVNLEKVNSSLYQLHEQWGQDSILGDDIRLVLISWSDLRSNGGRSILTLPSIRWHGTNNRYHNYVVGLLQGKFGTSKTDGRASISKIIAALKWTLSINVTSFILAGVFGLLLAMWTLKMDDTTLESGVSGFFYLWYTMPVFWSATLLVIFFTTDEYGAWTNLFPSVGIKYWYSDQPVATQILLNARQLLLPVICITLPSLAYVSRLMKAKFDEVSSEGFVTVLRAKGLDDDVILRKHLVKNGLIPYITIMTGSIPSVFAGSLVVEVIFNIPGIGKLMFDSILSNDWAVISGLVIMLSLITVLAFILADVLYAWANPRIDLVNS